MADQQIPFEFQTQFGDAAEQQRIAELLMKLQQQQRPALAGQMVSNHYVKPSLTQYLADLYTSWKAGGAQQDAAKMRQAVTQRMADAEGGAMRDVLHAATGTPAGEMGPPDEQGGMGYSPGQPPDPSRAAMVAASSPFPNVQKMGDDIRSNWQTRMTTGGKAATPESAVQAAQSGLLADLKPNSFSPVGPIATPPGQPPIYGQTESSGRVHFAPQGTNVSVNAARADQGLVAKH